MPRLRVALVGAGRIAQTWAEALEGSGSCMLTAVADVDAGAARRLAGDRCPAVTSLQELFALDGIDAVIIATPPALHEELAVAACEHRLHVLCEKPFALDSEGARNMMRAALRNEVKITMASKFRFVADVREARERMLHGEIGELVLFENTFCSALDMSSRWNADAAVSGGGVLIDNGTHSLDLFRYFCGRPSRILALEGGRLQGLDVEETVKILLETESGARGTIDLSWSLDKTAPLLEIYGTRGQIQVGWQGSRIRRDGEDWVAFGSGYDKLTAFRGQLHDFASAVRSGSRLTIGPRDAIGSVAAVEAAYRALRSAQPWSRVEETSEHSVAV